VRSIPFPDLGRNEKVVSFDFSSEGIRGDVEQGMSTLEVVMVSGIFVFN
jgi:hypothetical protein